MRVPGIPYVQGRNAYSDADGTKYGIAIHNTANDASAEGEASYATRRTDGCVVALLRRPAVSGVAYEYRAIVLGANGAASHGPWQG